MWTVIDAARSSTACSCGAGVPRVPMNLATLKTTLTARIALAFLAYVLAI
jgi:hypothetical protein